MASWRGLRHWFCPPNCYKQRPHPTREDHARPNRTRCHPRCGWPCLRRLRRRILAQDRRERNFSRSVCRCVCRGRLARHRHAGGIRRRGPRPHRSRPNDAGRDAIGRGLQRRVGDPSQHFRPDAGGEIRHRCAEGPSPAENHFGRGQSLLRRDGAELGSRHRESPNQSGAQGRHLHYQWPENLDDDGPACQQNIDDRAHHAERRSGEPDQWPFAFLYGFRPALTFRRRPFPKWGARRWNPTCSSSTIFLFRPKI